MFFESLHFFHKELSFGDHPTITSADRPYFIDFQAPVRFLYFINSGGKLEFLV